MEASIMAVMGMVSLGIIFRCLKAIEKFLTKKGNENE
jgi:hypothetical protein